MSLSIRTNVASLNTQRNLYSTQMAVESSLSKLSSGYRITKAGDDAAGLGISVNLEAEIRSYNQATRNAQDAISVVQTAEGTLNTASNIVSRLRELAMQSASDGIGNTERAYIQKEVNALTVELNRLAHSTEFNGQALLNNTAATVLTFQVGIRNVAVNDRIQVSTLNTTVSSLGLSALSLAELSTAQTGLELIDTAIQTVSAARATLGAVGNRLVNAVASIQSAAENLAAANSRIRDVDVSEESPNLMRQQILMQVGVAVMAQANQLPQTALKLIGQ